MMFKVNKESIKELYHDPILQRLESGPFLGLKIKTAEYLAIAILNDIDRNLDRFKPETEDDIKDIVNYTISTWI